MPTVAITGTIKTATGTLVENVVVILTPAPPDVGSAEAVGGVGIILTPDSVLTDVAGLFSIDAEQGFHYTLTIEAIGYERSFLAPATATVRFDLIGLTPAFESIADYTTKDAEARLQITVKADPVDTIRDRFDLIALERSTSGIGGPFVPIVSVDPAIPIQLEEGEVFYEVDIAGDPGDYWRTRFEHATNGDTGLYSAAKLGDSEEEALLMSIEELKELYLFGVDLTDSDGTPYPDRIFSHYIAAAVDWLSKELDIPLVAKDFIAELHDHWASDYGRWGWFQLRNYPVCRINKVAFRYPSQTVEVVIDNEWIVLVEEGAHGTVQIVPGQGNIADVLLIPGQLMPLWSGATGRVPGVWRFDYRAGFEVGEFPADLKHAVGMAASIGVFNIAGDLIAGAGIANISISVPGLSQSIGTTSSATNSGYGARIGEYQKELKQMLPNLRRFYGKGTKLVVA